jgi:hypothetical protein
MNLHDMLCLIAVSGFGGLVVSTLASVIQDHSFVSGRSRRFFGLPSEGK